MTNSSQSKTRNYRNPIILAKEYFALIQNGECKSEADLAKKLGVSRARVNQIMKILELPAEIQKMVIATGDYHKKPVITERMLRPLISLPKPEQKKRIAYIINN